MTSGVEVVVGEFLHDDHMDDRKQQPNNLVIYPWNDNNNDVEYDDAATANISNSNHSNHSHDFYLMHQQLLRAIARGDLLSVRRIVESISLSNEDEQQQQQQQQWRSMLINHADIWTETPPPSSSSSSVGGNNNNRAVLRLREATTTTMPRTTESSIQLGNVGYKFRKQFTAGWFTGTVVQILPLVHNTTSTTTTNDTTKKEDGGLEEGGGGDKKHDNYYRRCVYTDGDSEDLTVEDIIQLVKLDPNINKCSSNNNNNDTITNNVVKEEKDEESTNNNNNGVVMSSNTAASSSSSTSTSTSSTSVIQQLEWYDSTPLTLAVTRGHDDIVEYLLRFGA